MLRIRCVKCNASNVYGDERDAYLDGWYFADGRGYGPIGHQEPVQICQVCQKKIADEEVKTAVELVEVE